MNWKEFAKWQPEQGQNVIAAERLGKGEYHYFIATYKMGNFFTYTQAVSTGSNGKIKVMIEGRLDEVTHWMPAPEAPTEEWYKFGTNGGATVKKSTVIFEAIV